MPNLPPSWNVALTQAATVVPLNPETYGRSLDLLQRGLQISVILEEELRPVWLVRGQGSQPASCSQAKTGRRIPGRVSRAVNSVRNSGPDLLSRVTGLQAPPPSEAPPGGSRA